MISLILNTERLIFLWTEFICACACRLLMIKYFIGMVTLPVCCKNATNEVVETKVDFALMTETEAKMLRLLRPGLKYAGRDIL